MQGVIGQRTYYATLMKLKTVPSMFSFTDWAEFTPEDREQRVLNKKRIPDMKNYIVENEDGYVFSSITASYRCPVQFKPADPDGQYGLLEMDFEDAEFIINDGQHRCAAIAAAIKENPSLGEETISVLLFNYENRERVQQMFSDLNRYVAKTSKSLDILYDKRDRLSRITLAICEKADIFRGMVDKDAVSIPIRSPKLFSLAALYDATSELLRERVGNDDQPISDDQLIELGVDYWTEVSCQMPDWQRVKRGELRALELRQESLASHAVVLRALGGIGGELADVQAILPHLQLLHSVNWSKRNKDWEGICIVANSVVSNRQARYAMKAYLKKHLGLSLNEAEARALPNSAELLRSAEA